MKLRRLFALLVLALLFSATAQLMAQSDDGATSLPLSSNQAIDGTTEADNKLPTDPSNVSACNEGEPIAYTGHGVMFNTNGEEIQVTPQFINYAQKCYLGIPLQQANEQQRALFEQKQTRLLNEQQWDLRSELYANAALLEWLVKEVKPIDAGRLAGKLKLLQQTLLSPRFSIDLSISSHDAKPFELPDKLKKLLGEEGMTGNGDDSVSPSFTTLGGAAYINECNTAGVPIPPDWGTSQWISKGTLSNAEEFISKSLEAEAYVYDSNSPAGLCIALPRSQGNTIELLGIICLSKASSNACFWDNQRNKMGFEIQKGTVVPLLDFAGGADLFGGSGGVCTECHAGENSFVIHPNTNLGLPRLSGLDLFANDWYRPLVHPDWPQNIGPTNLLDSVPSMGKCTTCHTQTGGGGRFPELSTDILNGYCNTILSPASTRTMPPGNPGDSTYTPHVNALIDACKNPPGPPCNGTIFTNIAYAGTERGTMSQPFRTISAAYAYACNGATLKIKAGSYPELLNMNKNITLLADGGIVTIGDNP